MKKLNQNLSEIFDVEPIEEQVVKNIVSELTQAQLISRDVNNILSVKTTQSPNKHPESTEKNEWAPYRSKLKNLSRIL